MIEEEFQTALAVTALGENGAPLRVGDLVIVPDPTEIGDEHNHSFVGWIGSFCEGFAMVRDDEDNCFPVRPERLTRDDHQ